MSGNRYESLWPSDNECIGIEFIIRPIPRDDEIKKNLSPIF